MPQKAFIRERSVQFSHRRGNQLKPKEPTMPAKPIPTQQQWEAKKRDMHVGTFSVPKVNVGKGLKDYEDAMREKGLKHAQHHLDAAVEVYELLKNYVVGAKKVKGHPEGFVDWVDANWHKNARENREYYRKIAQDVHQFLPLYEHWKQATKVAKAMLDNSGNISQQQVEQFAHVRGIHEMLDIRHKIFPHGEPVHRDDFMDCLDYLAQELSQDQLPPNKPIPNWLQLVHSIMDRFITRMDPVLETGP